MQLDYSFHMRLELSSISPSGECVARHDGMVVFVPFGVPGEYVEAEVVHRRRNYSRATITEIVRESPERVAPLCPYFKYCGGCEWQHIDYNAQLRFKSEIVREQLERIGRVANPTVRACIASPLPYGYRNRIQLIATGDGHLGYRARGSHDVVAIDRCPIAHEDLNDMISQPKAAYSQGVDLRMDDQGAHALMPSDNSDTALTIKVNDATYRVTGNSFFQVNTAVAGLLVRHVLEAANAQSGMRVLDLYCGVGLFTVPLAQTGATVLGVESNPISAEDARNNLRTAGVDGEIVTGDVLDGLRRKAVRSQTWDIVVIDPPRAGIEFDTLQALMALRPARIVYVSCDPATLARDVHHLNENGWTLEYAQPFDMFPQTHHVETLALLVL